VLPLKEKYLYLCAAFLLCIFVAADLRAATVRGQLVCAAGIDPGVAVTVVSPQWGRSNPVYSGPDGMFYLSGIPAGVYTLEIWFSRSQQPMTFYPFNVVEPLTDTGRITAPYCGVAP